MRDEIAAAGKYKHPMLDREDDRSQVVTVAELFDGPGQPGRRRAWRRGQAGVAALTSQPGVST